MTWHIDILPRRQKRVLQMIGQALSRRGFFLVGGTAVALHLGHRRSVDFDWFTLDRFEPRELAAELREEEIPFTTDEVASGTLHGFVKGIRVTAIRHRYPLLGKLRTMPGRIHVADRADLCAMKLSAIAHRGAKKDFVDIYALGKRADSLRPMLRCYQKKYETENVYHLLRSLVYFEDAESDRMPRMLQKVKWLTIKKTLRRWVEASGVL